MSPQPPYMPTIEQIAEGCLAIQKGWSEEDYLMRAGQPTKLAARAAMSWSPTVLSEEQIDEMFGRRSMQSDEWRD